MYNFFEIRRVWSKIGFKKVVGSLLSMIKKFFYDIYNFGFKIAHYNFWGEFADSHFLSARLNKKIEDKRCELISNFLLRKFKYFIDDYENKKISIGRNDKKVRVLWRQGIDNAPDLVKICVNSIKKHNCGYEIILLDKDNYKQYVQLPNFILKKVEKKYITITHLSDIIRMSLLSQYGGIWVDSTMYFNDDIFKKFDGTNFNSNHTWCSFFLGGKTNRIFNFCYDFFLEYHKNFNQLINYFLIDYVLYICNIRFKDCHNDILCSNIQNDKVFELANKFNETYNEEKWNDLMKIPFHKLTWKIQYREYDKKGRLTNYGKFLEINNLLTN